MALLAFLALSFFLIVEPWFTSIKVLVIERINRVLLTFWKKVPRLSSMPVQIFIGQNLTSQRSKYVLRVIFLSIFILSALSFSKICSRQNFFVILQSQTHVGMYAYILWVGLHTYLMAFTNACFWSFETWETSNCYLRKQDSGRCPWVFIHSHVLCVTCVVMYIHDVGFCIAYSR